MLSPNPSPSLALVVLQQNSQTTVLPVVHPPLISAEEISNPLIQDISGYQTWKRCFLTAAYQSSINLSSSHTWTWLQGAIKYSRLAEFLPGKPDFNRKFGLFWPILANNNNKNSFPLTDCINFSQEILISCLALPGSRKNYSTLATYMANKRFLIIPFVLKLQKSKKFLLAKMCTIWPLIESPYFTYISADQPDQIPCLYSVRKLQRN